MTNRNTDIVKTGTGRHETRKLMIEEEIRVNARDMDGIIYKILFPNTL